ncbi:hypothetical protein FRC06_003657 [Ceratobasidium sp. 370]|nr:hypothetical protein FRC06_003657 [Ceratobasidium sp. 370]
MGVYWTLESATRFAIIVPQSASKAPFKPSSERDSPTAFSTPTSPQRNVAAQRLGMRTPSPWAIRHMPTRGGDRFSLANLDELYRPASKRFAAHYIGGDADVVDEHDVVSQRSHIKHTKPVPKQLKAFECLVARRIPPHRLELMDPLKLAVHDNLARTTDAPSRPNHPPPRSPLAADTSKPKSDQRTRRARPTLPLLNMDAARGAIRTIRRPTPLLNPPGQ